MVTKNVAIYPSANVERCHIENDWWAYNSACDSRAEPEPEPPLNNEWLGNFSDNLDHQGISNHKHCNTNHTVFWSDYVSIHKQEIEEVEEGYQCEKQKTGCELYGQ